MNLPVANLRHSHLRERLSSYGPDFLESFANKYINFIRDKGPDLRKLNVITGLKAEKLYRKFVRYVL
jgi:hypothetical protein